MPIPCGLLYRGSALAGLSPQACDDVRQLGVRTFIDLRTADEREGTPSSTCAERQARMVLAPMPTPYSVSPTDYLADLNTAPSVAAAFNVLGDVEAYPVYFHCVYGRDRTGVLAALILLTLGATPDEVMAEYHLTADSGLSVYPDSLQAVLDAIARVGGVEAFLASVGVSPAQLATLRTKLGVRH